jgi:hypothetical protein
MLLDTGRDAAHRLGQWQDALDLNAAVLASRRERGALATEIARTRFGDYGPLLSLGRTDEALALLRDCRQVFQDAHDTVWLGSTLNALAVAEDQRGHGAAALRLQRDALRYGYLTGYVSGIASSYHNLGNYLHTHARQPTLAVASHLTAALIRTLMGISGDGGESANGSTWNAARDLREFGPSAVPPRDIGDLCGRLADIPGTDLPRLIATLSPDPRTAEQTLSDLITQAHMLAAQPPPAGSAQPKRRWWRGKSERVRSE